MACSGQSEFLGLSWRGGALCSSLRNAVPYGGVFPMESFLLEVGSVRSANTQRWRPPARPFQCSPAGLTFRGCLATPAGSAAESHPTEPALWQPPTALRSPGTSGRALNQCLWAEWAGKHHREFIFCSITLRQP